jgi:hypothetical protein
MLSVAMFADPPYFSPALGFNIAYSLHVMDPRSIALQVCRIDLNLLSGVFPYSYILLL